MSLVDSSLADELSGVSDRQGFFKLAVGRLVAGRRAGSACTVAFVEVDPPPRRDDDAAASEAAVRTASALRSVFGDEAVIGRIGEGEFLVYADGEESPAEEACERLHEIVDRENEGRPPERQLSLSAGAVSRVPGPNVTLDGLLTAAHRRMYEDKRSRWPQPLPPFSPRTRIRPRS